MLRRVAFNPESPLIVRRAFDGYRIGDNFDASRCNIRRVGQLFRTGYLSHPGEAWEPVKDAVLRQVAAVAPVVQDVPDVPVEPDEPEPATEDEPSLVNYVNTGAGWYNVEVAGVVVNESKLKGLAAAQAWAAEQGYAEPA